MRLNRNLANVKPSPTLSLNAKAKALAASGRSIVNLTTGEPDFPTPSRICRAGIRAIENGETKYTASAGIPELRKEIAALVNREYGRDYSHESVIVTCGAKQALFNCCLALLNPGDEAIIFSPHWVSYPDMVEINGGRAVILPTEESRDFAPDLSRLEAALNERTRLIFLNTPGNPTGAVYDRRSLLEITRILLKWPDVTILSDDIYGKLIFDGLPFTSIGMIGDLPERQLVIINSVSKTYSMPGWRIGYAVGPKELISTLDVISSQSTSNAPSIAQWAALEAIRGDQRDVTEMKEEFQSRRDVAWTKLKDIPGLSCRRPGGAFYLFPNVSPFLGKRTPDGSDLVSDIELAAYLLESCGVALVPGTAFGAPGYLRLSFGSPAKVLEEGIDRIRKGLVALR